VSDQMHCIQKLSAASCNQTLRLHFLIESAKDNSEFLRHFHLHTFSVLTDLSPQICTQV
jgi:hypothetical protein